jgi:type VI secretion system protein ImpA
MVSLLDVDRLLKEISPDAPSGGKDLSDNPDYLALMLDVDKIGKESTGGKDKIGKESTGGKIKPTWKEIQDRTIKLLERTHDLRLAMLLTRVLLRTQGLTGFQKGLSLMHGFIEQHWDTMFPQNPIAADRTCILEELSDYELIIKPLMITELFNSGSLGKFSLRDIRIATGKKIDELVLSKDEKDSPPKLSIIEDAFKYCKPESLQNTWDQIKASTECIENLKILLKEKTGSDHFSNFKKINEVLHDMNEFFHHQLDANIKIETLSNTNDGDTENNKISVGDKETGRGMLKNRQDVIRVLDQVCGYYEQNEPGSPVPLLLMHARGLVEKSFLEILQDLAPESAAQIKKIYCRNE